MLQDAMKESMSSGEAFARFTTARLHRADQGKNQREQGIKLFGGLLQQSLQQFLDLRFLVMGPVLHP